MRRHYLNYMCKYKCKIQNDEKVVKYKTTRDAVCFARLFRYSDEFGKNRSKYSTKITFAANEEAYNRDKSQLCLISRKNMTFYLRYLKKFLDFKFQIQKVKSNYIVIVEGEHTSTKHKFLITCVRYMYEFDYNIVLAEAIALHRNLKYADFTLFDIINMVSVFRWSLSSGHGHMYQHCIYPPYSVKEVKENIATSSSVNSIFRYNSRMSLNDTIYEIMGEYDKFIQEFNDVPFKDIDTFFTRKKLEERCQVYDKIYKLMIDSKKV